MGIWRPAGGMAGRPEGLTRAEGPCPSGADPGGPTAYRCPHPTVPGPTWHPCGPWPLRACQQMHVPSSKGPRRLSSCSWELRSHTNPGGSGSGGQASPRGPQAGCRGRVAPRAGHRGWAAPRSPGRYQAGWSRAPTAHILSSWPETQRGTHRSAVATQRWLSAAGRQPIGDPARPQLLAASVVLLPRRAPAMATGTRLTTGPGCCPASWVFIL